MMMFLKPILKLLFLPKSSHTLSLGVCGFNDKVYVIGGKSGQRGVARCDVFDPKTQEWSLCANMNIGACINFFFA